MTTPSEAPRTSAPATLAVHAGPSGDPGTGATTVPVHHATAYAYATPRAMEDVFAGRAPGYVYGRIANPTVVALEARVAALEEGLGCLATSSGMAAIAAVMMALAGPGDEIVASAGLFGGTVSLFRDTLGRFGIRTVWVDADDTAQFARAVGPRTRAVFVETIGNPRLDVPDLPAVAAVARSAGIPLIVDSTLTTPVLVRPGRLGADLVIHSATKYINGHGTAIGGLIVDTGRYEWGAGPFEHLHEPARRAGRMALLAHLRNVVCRDLGVCLAPASAFLILQGLETLPWRMPVHCENARILAERLRSDPRITRVGYPGLAGSPAQGRVQAQFGGRAGGVFTLQFGSRERAYAFMDALRLARIAANLGDAKTLVIHPASTISREVESAERLRRGVPDDLVRVSAGLEDPSDLLADFDQALEHAIGGNPCASP